MFSKYFESGYSIIPLKPHSKKPMIDGWQKYCVEMPTEAQIELWDSWFEKGKCGIGICLGPASDLVLLDLDTNNPDTLSIAQKSPVSRFGSKGEGRFFRYSDAVKNKITLREKGIEVLSTGQQCVLPPSIHPNGDPYKWLSQLDLLSVTPEDLPELDPQILDLLPNINGAERVENVTPGRNNHLVGIVSAMRSRGEFEHHIIDEVYNYDKTHHSPRLFTDKSEGFEAHDEVKAKNNAWIFVNRVSQSLIKNDKAIQPFILQTDFEPKKDFQPKSFEYKVLPKAVLDEKSFTSRFTSLAVAASKGNVDNIALGGALSVLAAIACNRFRVGSTWPNLYVLNVAPSGFGKSAPQQLAQLCLQGSGLIGSSNYRSGASMYTYLPRMQERLDIIDEASMLFRAMKNGDTWQSEMQELLCLLFTCSNTYFQGVTVKGSTSDKTRSMNDGACFNPCINILASTTPQGYKESFDKTSSTKGLLPRFLVFNQHDQGEWKPYVGFKALEGQVQDVKAFCDDLLKFEKKIILDTTQAEEGSEQQNIGKKYDPFNYPLLPQANDLLQEFDRHYFNLAKRKDIEEIESAYYGRFAELATKIGLLMAMSTAKAEIDTTCIQNAIDIVEAQYHNSQLLRASLVSRDASKREVHIEKAIMILRQLGEIRVTKLRERFKGLSDREFQDMMKTLINLGLVVEKCGDRGASKYLYVGDHEMRTQSVMTQ